MSETKELKTNTLFVEVSGAGLPEVDGLFVPSKAPPAKSESGTRRLCRENPSTHRSLPRLIASITSWSASDPSRQTLHQGLGISFGIDTRFWMNLQSEYDCE